MKYTCSVAMGAIDDLVELARTTDAGHREPAEAGITDNIVIPWLYDEAGFDAPPERKKDSVKRFADTFIHSGWRT